MSLARRFSHQLLTLSCLALAVQMGLGCDEGRETDLPPQPVSPADPAPAADTGSAHAQQLVAVIPAEPGPFAPSFARVNAEGTDSSGELSDEWRVLLEVETCAGCHPEHVEQWRASAHAQASFSNPYYRLAIEAFRESEGALPSQHCGGCHDPVLLFGGQMAGAEISPDEMGAHIGVSCMTCHGIVDTEIDGNGSYTVSLLPLALPIAGDDASLDAHFAQVAPDLLRTNALCVSCHRGFLSPATGNAHFMIGLEDPTTYRRSAHAGGGVQAINAALEIRECTDCHMAAAPDGSRSHRFEGSHSALAGAMGDSAQLGAIQSLLNTAVSVDIAAIEYQDGSRAYLTDAEVALPIDETIRFDVVVTNVGSGHTFPGGTMDLQDTWIEVDVRDASDRRLASAGLSHARDDHDEDDHHEVDRSAFTFGALVVDEAGQPIMDHSVPDFRAQAWNHGIGPGDAVVVQYELELDGVAFEEPLSVDVRVRHRRHHLAYQRLACEASRNQAGLSYAEASAEIHGFALDVCAELPITDLATARVELGSGAVQELQTTASADWSRLYNHGIGLLHNVQERLEYARPSLERALVIATESGAEREQARTLVALARLEGFQGRTSEGLLLLDEAERHLPGHAATAFIRGRILALVWRWEEAAEAFAEALRRAPGSDIAHREYALALGSLGDYDAALEIAQAGLAIEPREPGLLRSQALALEALGAPDAVTGSARAAYLAHRPFDEAAQVRARCYDEIVGCVEGRAGVPVMEMVLGPSAQQSPP